LGTGDVLCHRRQKGFSMYQKRLRAESAMAEAELGVEHDGHSRKKAWRKHRTGTRMETMGDVASKQPLSR
jgi:hypothetical protein